MSDLQQNYDLALFQLAVYTLLTPFAFVIFFKVVLKKPSIPWLAVLGWFYLLGFLSLLLAANGLIIGAGKQSTSSTGLVLSAVGLAPLFVLVEGVLREAVEGTPIANNFLYRPVGAVALHFIVVTAAVLTGLGASDLFTPSKAITEAKSGSHLVKAGVVTFLLPWLWLVAMVALALRGWQSFSSTRKLIIASIVSLPLLLIRIIYGILEFYVTSTTVFNPLKANIVARLFMSVLPLMAVAITMVVAGFFTELGDREERSHIDGHQLTEVTQTGPNK